MHFRFALTNNSFRKKAQEIILNNDDNPITKKPFDDAVTGGFHYCNNLAHNNNTEMRFVSSGPNDLMSNNIHEKITQL